MSTGARFRTLSPGGELKTIFGVLAATAGIVVYVFVVGWIVELVRLSAARLPASAGVAALGSRQLFGVGLSLAVLVDAFLIRATGETLACNDGAEQIARTVALRAVSRPVDEIGAAIPLRGFRRIGLERLTIKEKELPAAH